jgi:hypothetical protein
VEVETAVIMGLGGGAGNMSSLGQLTGGDTLTWRLGVELTAANSERLLRYLSHFTSSSGMSRRVMS